MRKILERVSCVSMALLFINFTGQNCSIFMAKSPVQIFESTPSDWSKFVPSQVTFPSPYWLGACRVSFEFVSHPHYPGVRPLISEPPSQSIAAAHWFEFRMALIIIRQAVIRSPTRGRNFFEKPNMHYATVSTVSYGTVQYQRSYQKSGFYVTICKIWYHTRTCRGEAWW